jgi:hypothetical protein
VSEVRIQLDAYHPGQQAIVNEAQRFNVLQCGRRFGKTNLGQSLVIETAIDGAPAGYFAPTYKTMIDVWRSSRAILRDLTTEANKTERTIRLATGGLIEFWSLEDEDAGRSRKYKRVVIDEASVVRNLTAIWQASIRPTLTDLRGDAWFLGTPKGRREFHTLYTKGQSGAPGWISWRRGTVDNPFIDAAEVEEARLDLPETIFRQEYLGIPADDGGNPFGLDAIRRCVLPGLAGGAATCYGVDLAKSQDWTAVVGFDDQDRVVEVHRWQGPWEETINRLAKILGDTPALIDATGVGDPIVERLQQRSCSVEGFKFTQQSKQEIMLGLSVAIQNGDISLPDEPWLVNELESFGYEYTRTGVRYEAPAGLHDDGVCALALANKHRVHGRPKSIHIGVVNMGGGYAA